LIRSDEAAADEHEENEMSDRDGYEHGVPCWVTTIQPDHEAAGAFYGELFGWQLRDEHDNGYLLARLRGRVAAAVAPMPPGVDPPPAPAWVTAVWVDSADEAAKAATGAGGSLLAEPFDGPTGRLTVIADPSGAVLGAWEPALIKGAEVVNEPGAWAMSRLDTPDVDGAKEFYGTVFGWTNETFEMGDMSATMFRLPGYVGGEPEQPVSREVIAAMAPAAGDARARWGVDFWVHDVDAAARKAEELGGQVVAGPFDTPIGRSAVLADPAGATFSVTRIAK
jgi:predicted enzyme related to lactoylglutathione lyase